MGVLLSPALAGAQPASDYQLPPASPSPAPRAAGPVEEGAPAPTVAASPSAVPPPTPTPAIVIPTPAVAPARPTPRPRATTRVPDTAAAPAPGPSTTPVAAPSPDVGHPAATVAPTPEPSVAPPSDTPPVNITDAGEDWRPLAAGIAVAVFSIIAALLFWRPRRAVIVPTIVVLEPAPEPTPAPRAEPAPAPAPAPVQPAPIPPHQPVADPLVLRLEATRMSATLVNTTLAYRLIVVNRGAEPLTDIAIGGDMAAAHASKPMDEQLGLAGPELPQIHRIDRLEPGAELALPGEMRLPLSAITPIRAGEAALFVPLARFDAWASTPGGGAIHARAAYMVGQQSAPAAERLQPFRMDLGPRIWADLGQRALPLPVL